MRVTSLLCFTFLIISCSSMNDIMKSRDGEFKKNKAIEFYNREDYGDASLIFESILPFYRNTEQADDIYYYLAMSNYKLTNYIISSYYFSLFVSEFPQDPRAEECMFLSAYCYYLDSPKYNYDQESTAIAIQNIQNFVDTYPDSKKVKDANRFMDELIDKMEYKNYQISLMYYKMEEYKSATISLLNLLNDPKYDYNKYREDILYYVFMSYYNIFNKSVIEKKEYRKKEMYTYYKLLKKEYPNTKYDKDLKDIIENNNLELI